MSKAPYRGKPTPAQRAFLAQARRPLAPEIMRQFLNGEIPTTVTCATEQPLEVTMKFDVTVTRTFTETATLTFEAPNVVEAMKMAAATYRQGRSGNPDAHEFDFMAVGGCNELEFDVSDPQTNETLGTNVGLLDMEDPMDVVQFWGLNEKYLQGTELVDGEI